MENLPLETASSQKPEGTPVKRAGHRRCIIICVIVAVLLIAAGVVAYLWRDLQAGTQHANDTAQINTLKSNIDQLKKDATGTKSTQVPKASTKTPDSAATRSSISTAISSGNTAALDGYMASSVHVVIAASEGIGDYTPTQAITRLNYIATAVNPWNFSLDTATLAKYAAGSYKAYFLTDSLVGRSADGYVISFNFDNTGKISAIFMAIREDLLL